jgi:hypothetical protein
VRGCWKSPTWLSYENWQIPEAMMVERHADLTAARLRVGVLDGFCTSTEQWIFSGAKARRPLRQAQGGLIQQTVELPVIF